MALASDSEVAAAEVVNANLSTTSSVIAVGGNGAVSVTVTVKAKDGKR